LTKEKAMNATTIKDRAAEAAENLKATASEKLGQAGDTARNLTETVKEKAGETASAALDAAASRADVAKDKLVDGADRLETRLRDMASEDESLQARLLGKAADGVSAATETLRDRKLTELADDVKAFARKHPGAFAAGAAVVGFALARFVRSSARNARIARNVENADLARHWPKDGGRS
jgi:hypothetical protein